MHSYQTAPARFVRLAPWFTLFILLVTAARATSHAPSTFAAPFGLPADTANDRAALTEVRFDSPRWTFADAPPVRDTASRDSAMIVPGLALLRDVDFVDGVIEADVQSKGSPAVVFHAQSSSEYEEVYLRMGQSDTPVALQYVPVHHRFLPWRLYGENQGSATLDSIGRNHVRLEIRGRELKVFVNGAATPNLVATLRHEASGGAIGVSSFDRHDRFSHFRYAALPRAPQAATGDSLGPVRPGAIMQWTLSPFLSETTLDRRPPLDLTGWRAVTADGEGRLDISRWYSGLIREGRAVPVAARVVFPRERAGTERLAFGYCDRAVVWLNGRQIFSGSLPIKRNGDFLRMAMTDTLTLDLRAGPNELLVVTTGDSFGETNGGWGFAARLVQVGGTPHADAGDAGVEPGRRAPHTGA